MPITNIKLRYALGLSLNLVSINAHAFSWSSAGDDGNPNTQGNGAYAKPKLLSTAKLTSPTFGQYALTAVKDSFLQNGLFAIPGLFVTNLALGLLNEWIFAKEDPNKPLLDKLETMDKKLDTLIKDVQTSLQVTAQTQETLLKLYSTVTGYQFANNLARVNEALKDILIKNGNFKAVQAFGDLRPNQLDELYTYATKHKSLLILRNLDAKNASAIANDKTMNVRSSVSGKDTNVLYQQFSVNFLQDSSGSIMKELAKAKPDLITALNSGITKNSDLMTAINTYNADIIDARIQIAKGLQLLFNMQLTQLAYYYAVGADISLNLANMPAKNQGLTGFKQAAALLDQEYQQQFNLLDAKLKQNMQIVDNADLYRIVNNYIFNPAQPLLGSSFAQNIDLNQSNTKQCVLTNLIFNAVGGGAGSEVAIADLRAECYQGNQKWLKLNITIPFTLVGAKINHYAYQEINYQAIFGRIILNASSHDKGLAKQLSSTDIKAFADASSIKTGGLGGDMQSMRTTGIVKPLRQGFANMIDYNWGPVEIRLEDNALSNSAILPIAYTDDVHEAYLRRADDLNQQNTITYGPERALDNPTNTDGKMAKDFYYLANFRNHWFALKTQFGFYANTAGPRQIYGLGCLGNECERFNNTSLRWRDGTQVNLSETSPAGTAPYYISASDFDSLFAQDPYLYLGKNKITGIAAN